MNDQRTFAMFCTYEERGGACLFAEVADEIAAVQAFKGHVAEFNDEHIPHIHMEPMRAEWAGRIGFSRDVDFSRDERESFGPNLFRQPAQVSS